VKAPGLPDGGSVELPQRGRTWVYDSGPPSSATTATAAGLTQRPLVLLHGWTSTAALNWCHCFGSLSAEFRVLALDQRGHGGGIRSNWPFRLEDCADDAAVLLEQLGTGPVVVVGYSMGGVVAQLLWQRHREVVAGLVLCATAARFATRRRLDGAAGTVGYRAALALSRVPANVRRRGLRVALRKRRVDRGLAPWVVAEWESNDPAALAQAGFALGRFDSTGWIGAVDVPTSVVITTLDMTVSPRRQWLLKDSIPGACGFPVAGDHRACADVDGPFVRVLVEACRAVLPTSVST
jgi:3-oxoadipate enol-lactonase